MLEIPTDNFYKFLAISGLIAFGFCFYFPEVQVLELESKYYEARLLEVDILTEKERLLGLSSKIHKSLDNLAAVESGASGNLKSELDDVKETVSGFNNDYYSFLRKL